jgi:LPS sulfotransferase NodH
MVIANRGYAICTTPRSGSNFLSQLLTSTGVLGRPLEYFNGPARRVLDHPDFPDDPEAQLAAIPRLGATPNGIYGLKLFMSQFDQVAQTRWPCRLPGLSFVYLERRDVLGQAISWARAEQTGQYRSTSSVMAQPTYDPALIRARLSMLLVEQARWRDYFAVNAVTPLCLLYEDVARAPAPAVEAVSRLMGLTDPPRIDPERIDLAIQRDALNDDWRARFVAEHADPAVPPGPWSGHLPT